MKHKHYDLIVAWANDPSITLQYRVHSSGTVWDDLGKEGYPSWLPEMEYRIKPKELKFRNFLAHYGPKGNTVLVVSWEDQQKRPREAWATFIDWIGDWQTVEEK